MPAKSKHPLYELWSGMRARCYYPKHNSYKYYGAKGITIDPEWDDFWTFVKDMGDRPSRKHSLDRINTDKNYNKGNCRWATRIEQNSNRKYPPHCRRGHPWTEETEWSNGPNNGRKCKICYNITRKALRA